MESERPPVIEIPDPPQIGVDESSVAIAYVDDKGQLLGDFIPSSQMPSSSVSNAWSDLQKVEGEIRQKSHDLSRQSHEEIGSDVLTRSFESFDIVEPPYPPKCLANFLAVDPVFFRSVKAKVLDSVGRDFVISPKYPIKDENDDVVGETITRKSFLADQKRINLFIQSCNDVIGFQGVLERAAMDYEAIGWAAIEVIRNFAGMVVGIDHIPAQRLRVLKGFKGFAEIRSDSGGSKQYTYYQRFGEKFKVAVTDGDSTQLATYNPNIHGRSAEFQPQFVSAKTGKATRSFEESANEILYLPKHHINTIYYGYSDAIPALGAIVGNVHIRDYMLQFFEHNTIPRYAVIVKGAKIDDDFRKLITEYFNSHIKGAAHKTLILTLQGIQVQNISIKFKKLDSDNKEADFLETRTANSNQIMSAMGVSPAILGIAEHSELGSGKGLSQAEIYKDRIVSPTQRIWAHALNTLFANGLRVVNAVLSFNPLDIRDRLAEMQVLTGYQALGDLTSNEVRKSANLGDALPGGDTAFVRIKEGAAFKVSDLPDLPGPLSNLPDSPESADPPENLQKEEENDDESESGSDIET